MTVCETCKRPNSDGSTYAFLREVAGAFQAVTLESEFFFEDASSGKSFERRMARMMLRRRSLETKLWRAVIICEAWGKIRSISPEFVAGRALAWLDRSYDLSENEEPQELPLAFLADCGPISPDVAPPIG